VTCGSFKGAQGLEMHQLLLLGPDKHSLPRPKEKTNGSPASPG
jgi:hypothetical protein